MSVLIRGMEMPQTCRDCPLEQPYDGYNCAINKKSYSLALSGRSSDCPLIPVLPHGRLIDADAYKQEMKDCRMAFWDEVLDSMPTIIHAEEGE